MRPFITRTWRVSSNYELNIFGWVAADKHSYFWKWRSKSY